MVWGTKCDQELERSIASVERFGLKTHVVRAESRASLHQKSQMDLVSPFDETLFLDSDTYVLQELSFGFEMSLRFGLAMTIAPACNANLPDPIKGVPADLVQYNTGVIFFTKTQPVRKLFETWRHRCDGVAYNDQPPFAHAVYETGVAPFVLPMVWNYRPKYRGAPLHGPLKIWHGRQPLPGNVEEYNRTTTGFGFVEKNWRGQYRIAGW
jgi:hypothetical protein